MGMYYDYARSSSRCNPTSRTIHLTDNIAYSQRVLPQVLEHEGRILYHDTGVRID